MSEMARSLQERVTEATTSLNQATESGDDYMQAVRVGELEELNRLAHEHDIDIPGLDETIAAHTGPIQIVLPKDDPVASRS